jgi:hypothetical protein
MKERLRRVILFIVIVITGSVLIFFDVPLVILIPFILATGVVVLVLLGAITPSDIRSVFKRPKSDIRKKTGILKQLDEMKFFEKKPAQPDKKPAPVQKKGEPGIGHAGKTSPLRSFLSSLGSLGAVLRERNRQKKKVEHINDLLDKAVSEKVKVSALAGAGTSTGIPGSSGGASGPGDRAQEQDPFMSLSGDEFDVSLLDGLEDTGPSLPPAPGPGPGPVIPEPDIPLPSPDFSTEADNILKDNAGGLEEFSGLEGGESLDQDFRDLDNLDLDDIDLNLDPGEETPATASPAEEKPVPSPAAATGPAPVKTAWIPSDAPPNAGNAGDQASLTADMVSFSKGASGSDEDMLSSLASDVKQVKKERNLSLIRDLKDFKAPAQEIEDELKETCERLKAPGNRTKTGMPPAKGMK